MGRSCRQSLHRTFALFPQKISIRLAETVHQDASLFRLVSGISSGFWSLNDRVVRKASQSHRLPAAR
jgi:hypothetical protein